MTPERWLGVRVLLTALKDLPVEEKERRIQEAYPHDAEFRRQVIELQLRCERSTQSLSTTQTWPDTPKDITGPVPASGDMCGPYRIKHQIGAGGMGRVFLAQDTLLPREVALKTLRATSDPEFDIHRARTRIRDEAARQAELHGHPHIATLLHVVEAGNTGLPVLVMEYVEGTSASVQLANGPVRVKRVLKWAHQVASAIDHAHNRGILHCDLKPANIQITTNDDAKVLDFGLARAIHSSSPGPVGGTLPYMAPEQVVGGSFSEASDLYSFGVTLFELITGQRPFDGRSREELIHEILGCPPPKASAHISGLPEELDEVLQRAIAKDPRERFRTARELANELSRSVGEDEEPIAWWLKLLIGSSAVAILATVLGFFTSRALDLGLGRTGAFRESPLVWPVWGLMMFTAPVLVFGTCLVGIYLMWIVCRIVFKAPPIQKVFGPTVDRVATLFRKIRSVPRNAIAQILLIAQVTALVLLGWSFYPLLLAVWTFVEQNAAGSLRELSPANGPLHSSYREYSSLCLFVFSAAWYWLFRTTKRGKSGSVSLGGKLAAVAVTIVTLFAYSLPFRPLRDNEFPKVSYRSEPCYITASSGEEVALYCPFLVPRTITVKESESLLEKTGITENVFTEFGDQRETRTQE